jgi:hypothetical protein
MKGYFTKAPYVSANFKKTYCKQLEIYEGEITKSEKYGKPCMSVTSDTIHTYGKNGWVAKPYCNWSVNSYNSLPETSIPDMRKISDNTIFTSLELAKAAKILKIQDLGVQYTKALKNLQDTFYKNVPDVSAPADELRKDHPEFFI